MLAEPAAGFGRSVLAHEEVAGVLADHLAHDVLGNAAFQQANDGLAEHDLHRLPAREQPLVEEAAGVGADGHALTAVDVNQPQQVGKVALRAVVERHGRRDAHEATALDHDLDRIEGDHALLVAAEQRTGVVPADAAMRVAQPIVHAQAGAPHDGVVHARLGHVSHAELPAQRAHEVLDHLVTEGVDPGAGLLGAPAKRVVLVVGRREAPDAEAVELVVEVKRQLWVRGPAFERASHLERLHVERVVHAGAPLLRHVLGEAALQDVHGRGHELIRIGLEVALGGLHEDHARGATELVHAGELLSAAPPAALAFDDFLTGLIQVGVERGGHDGGDEQITNASHGLLPVLLLRGCGCASRDSTKNCIQHCRL